VCNHPKRIEVDRALVEGGTLRVVAGHFGLAVASLQRHGSRHVGKAIKAAEEARTVASKKAVASAVRTARAVERAEVEVGESSLATAERLVRRAMDLLAVAEVRGADGKLTRATDIKAAVAALASAAKVLDLKARLGGEIKTGSTTNVLVDQRGRPTEEWAELTGVLFAALRPWPDAARAAAAALASAANSEAPRLGPAGPGRGSPAGASGDVVEGEIEPG
jgi:hypothetical protein